MVRRRLQWWLWACGIFCFFASLMHTGYHAATGNRAIHLALIHFLRDPSLYSTDPIRTTFPYYVSMLWQLVSWLPSSISLEQAEFVFFLLVRALVFLSAVRLAQVLAPGSVFAVMGVLAMLALVPQPIIAMGTIMESSFEQSGTAIPFILLAVADFFDRRYLRAALWLGIVVNLTVLYAVYVLPYIIAFALCHPFYRVDWRRWGSSVLLLLLVSVPVIAWVVLHPAPPPRDMELWYTANRFRSAHHLFPLAFAMRDWLVLAVALLFTVGLSVWMGRSNTHLRQMGIVWSVVALVWLALAFVVAYGVQSVTLMRLQPAKAVDLWVPLAAILTVCMTSQLLDRVLVWGTLWYQLVGVAAWGIAINLWSMLVHLKVMPFFVVGAILILIVLSSLERRHPWSMNSAWKHALVGGWLLLTIGLNAYRDLSARERLMEFSSVLPVYRVAEWAKNNTPKDALFLVPPGDQDGWLSFRALSQRSVFVTWKDGTHILFDPGYTEEWVTRVAKIGFDIRVHRLGLRERSPVDGSNINELYAQLHDDTVLDLASQYNIDFWVVAEEQASHFPVVYSDGRWKVLQVRAPASSTTPTSQPNRNIHK